MEIKYYSPFFRRHAIITDTAESVKQIQLRLTFFGDARGRTFSFQRRKWENKA